MTVENPYQNLKKLVLSGEPEPHGGFDFYWLGIDRVPERIIIPDPSDPVGKKLLYDFEVDYMRDGLMTSSDGETVVVYERVSDNVTLPHGTVLNHIVIRG